MYNDLFSIGPLTIHGYGLMIGIGVVFALIAGLKLARKKGLDPEEIYSLTFLCVVLGFLSAKVLFCIVEWRSFIDDPLSVLGSNGFVVYGGIIGAVFFSALYCRHKKLDFWKYFDVIFPSVAIAQGFGRIGCFLAGCCYGRETDSFLGITFHDSHYAPNNVSLYPTQLFSSIGCFIMAAVLFIYIRKDRKSGTTGSLYLIMYSIGRAVIEGFRNDYRGAVGPLSTSQFISIFILIAGIVLYVLSSKGTFTKSIDKSSDTH